MRSEGKKSYSLFRSELLEWYRSNKPNSGLPSEIVIGVLYDKQKHKKEKSDGKNRFR